MKDSALAVFTIFSVFFLSISSITAPDVAPATAAVTPVPNVKEESNVVPANTEPPPVNGIAATVPTPIAAPNNILPTLPILKTSFYNKLYFSINTIN